MTDENTNKVIKRHLQDYATSTVDFRPWRRSPVANILPHFEIAEVHPSSVRPIWSFMTIGCWETKSSLDQPAEFVLAADNPDGRNAEILAMAAYYNCDFPLVLEHNPTG